MDWDFAQQMLFWAFVPNLATKFLQSQYYSFFKPNPKPTPAQAKFHYNVIYCLVIVVYLVYSFVQVERNLPPTYYDYLGVPINADMKDLRTQFRQLSLVYHPDKLQSLPDEERVLHEARYLHMRQAYDVLKEPVTRSAYDKYGMTIQDCTRCITERDYLMKALPQLLTFYGGSTAVLLLLSFLGTLNFGRYWRFTGLLSLASIETAILFSPTTSTTHYLLRTLLPWRTTHEHITILHQLFIILSIALSQIGPILFPTDTRNLKQWIIELESLTNLQASESAKVFRSAFEPFARDPVAVRELQKKMEKMAVDLKVMEGDRELVVEAVEAQKRVSSRNKK